LADNAQGWSDVAQSHYQALRALDRAHYCPYKAKSEESS
jgi:hypothetical protein